MSDDTNEVLPVWALATGDTTIGNGDARPPVPHGSPDGWWWQELNEWGFEGWVPEETDGGDNFNDFTYVYGFGEGILIEVRPSGVDGECLTWIVPRMSRADLEQWMAVNTPAYELQNELDDFFAMILEGFVVAECRPEGTLVFQLGDYDGYDIIDVLMLPDGSYAAWSEQHRAVLRCADLCDLRRAYDDRLDRHWSPMRMSADWEQRWDDCS